MNENNSFYETFEKLLSEKKFEELDDAELHLVLEFVPDRDSYRRMQQVLIATKGLLNESNDTPPPVDGASDVWQRYQTSIITPKKPFHKRNVSIWWPSGIAAALILSLWIRVPSDSLNAESVFQSIDFEIPVLVKQTDTVIEKVPVYIQVASNDIRAHNAVHQEPQGSNVFVPTIASVNEFISRRQGTNMSEMGDLSKLSVSLP